jgi:polysaccharide deacetylase family protein (PEP-CTERM system associated)
MINILTIDLEEWFHPLQPDPLQWNCFERRVENSVDQILELLNKYNSSATFFVLGDVAEHKPALIKKIASEGHEIGSHNYYHYFIYNQKKEDFKSELKKSISILESLTSEKIISFRAPYFSITSKSLWALDILLEEGIKFDSSIYPIYNHRYGIPGSNTQPYEIINGLWEFPISVFNYGKINIPFAGGVYFRFLHPKIFNILHNNFKKKNKVFTFYIHPWEWDINQPKYKPSSSFLYFRHYHNLKNSLLKIESLLKQNRYHSINNAFKKMIAQQVKENV